VNAPSASLVSYRLLKTDLNGDEHACMTQELLYVVARYSDRSVGRSVGHWQRKSAMAMLKACACVL